MTTPPHRADHAGPTPAAIGAGKPNRLKPRPSTSPSAGWLSRARKPEQREPEALQFPLATAAGAERRENLKILKPVGHKVRRSAELSPTFSRHSAPAGGGWKPAMLPRFPALGSVRRREVSSPGNSRNLTRIVRPTRAIGVAAVLALSGHGCHHIARLLVHLAEDREVRSLIEAGRVGPDQEEL
jgi:hypothetical protein